MLAACFGFHASAQTAPIAAAQTAGTPSALALATPAALARVSIDNFGEVDPNYFRGAQPRAGDYRDLAALGIKTVIDLTKDGRTDEPRLVKQAGMHFYRIPLTTSDRPSAAAVARFLGLVGDPANQPVYVHCQGGRHRTGAMTAVYRITHDGWTADRAYEEMRQYRFESLLGHPELKKFVFAYDSRARAVAADRVGTEGAHVPGR